MRAFVGVTDINWFNYLASLPNIDEVNFWQPSGRSVFRALDPGEIFLFKLHSPLNYIVGGGFFAHSTILPINLAWEAFKEKNGAPSFTEMRKQIDSLRRDNVTVNYNIGCILLEQPFFFERPDWIPAPRDWKPNIVKGKIYDLSTNHGKVLFEQVQERLTTKSLIRNSVEESPGARYGSPVTLLPRLGQGSFRVIVTDAYQRKCAITRERTLPALEAAHIKPFKFNGPHRVNNGILLRSDIHRLFDTGYVTITEDHRFEVSRRIREEFENGRDYYNMKGKVIDIPLRPGFEPAPEFIRWHNENVFRG